MRCSAEAAERGDYSETAMMAASEALLPVVSSYFLLPLWASLPYPICQRLPKIQIFPKIAKVFTSGFWGAWKLGRVGDERILSHCALHLKYISQYLSLDMFNCWRFEMRLFCGGGKG